MIYETTEAATALEQDQDMMYGNVCTAACRSAVDGQKNFHINDIISLSSGLMLAQEGAAALYRLVGFVMDCDATAAETRANIQKVKNCVEEQLPFLHDINLDGVQPIFKIDPSPTNPYLVVWLEMQALRFGEEHPLMTYAAWQAQKNKQQKSKEQANKEQACAANTNTRMQDAGVTRKK
ncbi:MAG: hypothetical protein RBS08_00765 [Bdellovibrionales bacterium]|nr:hypothetical protein [Bdellovibrionales bacterium]